ncbi:MAG: hypothetical protein IJP92_13290 [Lachnospiraceae bacterium]|nr:hypothetical protein [Lachnospiraceae bacterium]
MDYDYQILKLTDAFYRDYPQQEYPEMLLKETRAYNCLLIDLHYDYYICIPFRTEMHHTNGYRFKSSERSRSHQSGLDYSKIAIIQNGNYLGTSDAVVDRDEYLETISNMDKIVKGVDKYIKDYICHKAGTTVLNEKEFERKYRYATLKYFHKELSIK